MARISGDTSDQSEAVRDSLYSESIEAVQCSTSSFLSSGAGSVPLSPLPVVMNSERCTQRSRQAFALLWESSQWASFRGQAKQCLRGHRPYKLEFRPVLSETIFSVKTTLWGISQRKHLQ